MSGSQPTRRNGLPTTISPTTAPVPEPATLRRVPDAPAEAADEEHFHAWRMPFPGHDRRRPTRIEPRFTARGRPDSRDVFRAISENDAGRGRVGAPTSAPVSVTDAVSDPATAVCTRRTTPAFVRQRARALRCRHARPGRPAGSADARIGALPAPASVKGSSDALTARIHAIQQRADVGSSRTRSLLHLVHTGSDVAVGEGTRRLLHSSRSRSLDLRSCSSSISKAPVSTIDTLVSVPIPPEACVTYLSSGARS
jgi:hypothetical protein